MQSGVLKVHHLIGPDWFPTSVCPLPLIITSVAVDVSVMG